MAAMAGISSGAHAQSRESQAHSLSMMQTGTATESESVFTSPQSAGQPEGGKMENFVIMSVPKIRMIMYVVLGRDTTMRPLVIDKLISPKGIAVDKPNMRLFVADPNSLKIYWYQLIRLPDGRLITDGQQRVAVDQVEATYINVNALGDLLFSGKLIIPPPYSVPSYSIFRMPNAAITTGATLNPFELWNRGFSADHAWAVGPV